MTTINARKLSDVTAAIKHVREQQGLSQSELAEELVISRDYLIDLESGQGNIYTTRLFRALHKLGITITLSFDGEPDAT